MADNTVPISEVPKDIDPMAVGTVTNPTKKRFETTFNSEKVVLKAGESATYPLPMAIQVAFNLCEQEVRKAFKEKINLIEDEKKRDDEARKAIPGYKENILKMMKAIVKTNSDYLDKVDPRDLR
jgi:hypothetical protein